VLLEPLDSLDPSLQIVEYILEVKEDGFTVVEIGKLTHQLKSGTESGGTTHTCVLKDFVMSENISHEPNGSCTK